MASDAPWPPSFQPRNAAIRIGRSSSGRLETMELLGHSVSLGVPGSRERGGRKNSAASVTVPAQTAAASATWTSTSSQGSFVRHCSSPTPIWTIRSPSMTERDAEQLRRALAVRGEIADREQEREQEEADEDAVHVDGRLRASQSGRCAAPPPECGPAGGRERAADDEREARRGEERAPGGGARAGRSAASWPSRRPSASTARTTAPARSAIESSRCAITTGQRRSLATAR